MVLRRARAALPLPDGVELAFDAGALTLSGSTSPALAAELVQLARLVPGVASVAHAGLRTIEPPSRAELDAALAALAEREFAFDPGRAEPASDAELQQLASDLRAAAELADKLGFRLVATSYGLTDELGAEDINAELRDARARWLAGALVAATGLEVSVANLEPAETRATLKRRAARLALRLEPRTEP
jgi:outer membrane protein OmpA-like peptidoglycan-associated protein